MITQPMGETRRLTYREWNGLVWEGLVEDLSSELPSAFLMVGQKMRAKIKLNGRIWMASAWFIDGNDYVDLIEVVEEKK